MPGTSSNLQVPTAGGVMAAHLVVPEAGGGPGVVVLQEIFGVNPYVRRAAARLAELGYVALAPDLYWRTDPGLELPSGPASMARAMAAAQRLDRAAAVGDSIAALEHLRGLQAVTGRSGVLGFCLGGALAFGVAAQGDPDCAVCYYGSGIAEALDRAKTISCPVLFHFGGDDPYISPEQSGRVAALAEEHEGMECHIHPDAGHAFDNHDSAMFHQPQAATAAWQLTADFLARTIGESG